MLKLNGNGKKDETAIYLTEGASMNFDSDKDARKIVTPDAELPFIAAGQPNMMMAINGIPNDLASYSIPVSILTPLGGDYTITSEGMDRFPDGTCIMLEDLMSGEVTNLVISKQYRFHADPSALAMARFVLHVTPAPVATVKNASCNNTANGAISLKRNYSIQTPVKISKADGTPVQQLNWNSTELNLDQLAQGMYHVEVMTGGMCGLAQFEVNVGADAIAEGSISVNAQQQTENGIVTDFEVKGIQGNDNITWDFGDGTILNGSSSIRHTYAAAGDYSVSARTYTGDCNELLTLSLNNRNVSSNDYMNVEMREGRWYAVFKLSADERVNISILNAMGQQIGTQLFNGKLGMVEIDLSELAKGTYLIRLQGNGKEVTRKVVH
jgi:hypothetical protein